MTKTPTSKSVIAENIGNTIGILVNWKLNLPSDAINVFDLIFLRLCFMQKANKTSTFPRIVITLTELQNTVRPNLQQRRKNMNYMDLNSKYIDTYLRLFSTKLEFVPFIKSTLTIDPFRVQFNKVDDGILQERQFLTNCCIRRLWGYPFLCINKRNEQICL